MDNKKLIKKIIKFFDSTFTIDSFNRMVDMNDDCGYAKNDWEKFYENNINCIIKLPEKN